MSTVLSPNAKPSAGRAGPTKSASRLRDTVDAKLDQLIKEVLPLSPYILRLQQQHGRRLPIPSQSYHWMQGTLFSPDEQELQYMTFRPPMDGMLHAHGQWDDGKGGIAPRDGPVSQTSSGRTPLQSQGVKKKITLEDYKNRDRSKIVNGNIPAAQQAQKVENTGQKLSGKVTHNVRGEDIQKLQSENASLAAKKESKQTQHSNFYDQKRSTDAVIVTEPPQAVEAARSAKKNGDFIDSTSLASQDAPMEEINVHKLIIPRTKETAAAVHPDDHGPLMPTISVKIPEQATNSPDVEMQESVPDDGLKKLSELPPMLSPTLPDIKLYKLPPLLSPTLPPEIEAAIAEAKSSRPRSNGSFTASSRAPSASFSSKRDRSDTATSIGHASSAEVAKSSSPIPFISGKQPKNDSKSTISTEDPLQIKKPMSWVTLKIKKKYRRELSQYLRLKPTPSKSHWRKHIALQQPKLEDNSGAPVVMSNERKRPRSKGDDPRPHIKRRRGSNNLSQREITPNLPVSSPLPSNIGSAPKSRLVTPSKFPKSNAMHRAGSWQGSVTTPLGQSQHGTPSNVGRESPLKQDKMAEYRAESTRLVSLARDLKHDSDKYLKIENASENQQKLGVMIATESVLCFILAAVVYDEPSRRDGHAGNTAQWGSILPLLRILTERSKPYQHIYGLLQQLEGVIRDTIHRYGLLFMRYSGREYEKTGLATELEAVWQRHRATLNECYENQMKALSAWSEGERALWIKDLPSAFPKTWSQGRSRLGRGKTIDAVQLRAYAKYGFILPIGHLTSGLDAVNFGLSILAEHCEKEGIQWTPKLIL